MWETSTPKYKAAFAELSEQLAKFTDILVGAHGTAEGTTRGVAQEEEGPTVEEPAVQVESLESLDALKQQVDLQVDPVKFPKGGKLKGGKLQATEGQEIPEHQRA